MGKVNERPELVSWVKEEVKEAPTETVEVAAETNMEEKAGE